MRFREFERFSEASREELMDLMMRIDKSATGENYEVSTAEMSREMYGLSDEISDRNALRSFFEREMGLLIVAYEDEDPVGFTIIKKDYKYFREVGAEEYFPNISIIFTGVHPSHQREGIWTYLREYVEDRIVPRHDIEYLVSAASAENKASREANKSLGMREVRFIDLDEEDRTVLLVKDLD